MSNPRSQNLRPAIPGCALVPMELAECIRASRQLNSRLSASVERSSRKWDQYKAHCPIQKQALGRVSISIVVPGVIRNQTLEEAVRQSILKSLWPKKPEQPTKFRLSSLSTDRYGKRDSNSIQTAYQMAVCRRFSQSLAAAMHRAAF